MMSRGGLVMKEERKSMAAWFDPGLLMKTGVRAAVSTAFGQFADKREAIAAANAVEPAPADGEFDYAARHSGGDFWFDYLADTGDGWNATYAMARLLAKPSVDPTGSGEIPRGRLLVLGGDQVYPTASKEEYRARFIGPFDKAYETEGGWSAESAPHLFAIPGNHDWYDGLNSFFGLFCRRRVARPEHDLGVSRDGKVIGGRPTLQTRSYFAIKLPGDWWLWGTDSQLEGYIDQPQIDYFQHAAAHWMEPKSKLILCVADPSWVYVDPDHVDRKFESFSYLERLAGLARMPAERDGREDSWPAPDEPMGHQLKLVLTGDSHHYAHYTEDDRHYVVCGGGGAFLHPTHQLEDHGFHARFPKPGEGSEGESDRRFALAPPGGKKRIYPSAGTSRLLAFGNLLFPLLNPSFVAFLAAAYLLFNSILDFNAHLAMRTTLAAALRKETLGEALDTYVRIVFTSPASALLFVLAWIGYCYFADWPNKTLRRLALGTFHSALHLVFVTLAIIATMWWLPGLDGFWAILVASITAALASGWVFGAYLLISLQLFKRHTNEGFSSMRIAGYKSFLRLRIDAKGTLTVHPIGVRKVPRDRGQALRNPDIPTHLIEVPFQIV
jgi:hypothetical protein